MQQERYLPETHYHGIAAIILFQCTLESYINYLIYDHKVADTKVGKAKLIELSIKQKWAEFPKVVVSKSFDEGQPPFSDFDKLVDLRNKLIHLHTKKIDVEIPLPKEEMTVGEVRDFLNQPGTLSGHILGEIPSVALSGRETTANMLNSLHKMLGTEAPSFLSGQQSILSLRTVK
jgi:hypothetical protein